MSDLAEFLLARIAEDESSARGAVAYREQYGPYEGEQCINGGHYDDVQFTPARWLDECDAKRRIIHLHYGNDHDDNCRYCLHSDDAGWPCTTLRLLALPYAGHPDYQQEWAVT